MLKNLIILLARFLLFILADVKMEGIENLSHDQPVIITANHIGFLDGVLILSLNEVSRHPNLVVIIAEHWQEIPVLRWAVKQLGWIFIDRFNPDIKSMRQVLKRMQGKSLMVIAPEGTRSKTGALIEGKPGAAYITAKSRAIIIPTALTGTEDKHLKKWFTSFKRIKILVKFGEPYQLPQMPNKQRNKYLAQATDEIMCRIAALLPESYRGIYSDNPRLIELLTNV